MESINTVAVSVNNSIEGSLAKVTRETANPRRGESYHAHALDFAAHFPVGSELTQDAFAGWARSRGLLNTLPPLNAPKDSDEWLAHLQRRHTIRVALNSAASHPRMQEGDKEPFFVHSIADNTLKVDRADASFNTFAGKVPGRQQSLFKRQKKQLRYLRESVDFDQLLPVVQLQVDQIAGMIDDFESEFDVKARNLSRRFETLQHNIQLQVERGELVPKNGGIKQLLAPSEGARWREYNKEVTATGEQPTSQGFHNWLMK
jgi:hypothetical protein